VNVNRMFQALKSTRQCREPFRDREFREKEQNGVVYAAPESGGSLLNKRASSAWSMTTLGLLCTAA